MLPEEEELTDQASTPVMEEPGNAEEEIQPEDMPPADASVQQDNVILPENGRIMEELQPIDTTEGDNVL